MTDKTTTSGRADAARNGIAAGMHMAVLTPVDERLSETVPGGAKRGCAGVTSCLVRDLALDVYGQRDDRASSRSRGLKRWPSW
jgi:hypothetical protein